MATKEAATTATGEGERESPGLHYADVVELRECNDATAANAAIQEGFQLLGIYPQAKPVRRQDGMVIIRRGPCYIVGRGVTPERKEGEPESSEPQP